MEEKKMPSYHVYRMENGKKVTEGVITHPEAKERATARIRKVLDEEGRIVFAEPFNGPKHKPLDSKLVEDDLQ